MLLHGFAGNTDSWEDVAPLLHAGGVRAIAIDRVGFGRTERPTPPSLPPPPPLPGRELVAEGLNALVKAGGTPPAASLQSLLPDPRAALATALLRPATLAPRLPWELSRLGRDPYAPAFAVEALSPLLKTLLADDDALPPSGPARRIFFVGHSAGGPVALRALCAANAQPSLLPRWTRAVSL